MARVFSPKIITAIDIGTTKICVLIAQQIDAHQLTIIGVGQAPSNGLRKGVVVDIAQTIHAVKAAVKEAELMAGLSVEIASIGISGSHIKSLNSSGAAPIKKGFVKEADITQALAASRAVRIPDGFQILHVIPQFFCIDEGDPIQDPRGMHGVRLTVQSHMILGAIASVQNLVKCCQVAGVNVQDIILEQLASADAVLSADEKELGVAMLDIGGGTSDLAVFRKGSIIHTMVLPIAGNNLTYDIAIGLRATMKEAERVKKEHGIAAHYLLNTNELMEVEMIQEHQRQLVQRSDLVNIIEPRIEELLFYVKRELEVRSLISQINTGYVLTGGGSLLTGLMDFAEYIFEAPVRIGHPIKVNELNRLQSPEYATGYGLLIYALKKQNNIFAGTTHDSFATRIMDRMKTWVTDFF